MFYLKCLENAPNESVLDIIKQEIEARPRFVLCQSENTLKSYWVQQEIEYIKSIKRPYEIINLNDSNSIARGIDSIYKRSNVLIISSRVEKDISNKIEQMGYNTYLVDENMVTYNYFGGMNFQQYENMVYQKCLHSLKNGYCLLLLYDQTEFYKTHYQTIINIAMSNKEYIDYLIPIIMEENITVSDNLTYTSEKSSNTVDTFTSFLRDWFGLSFLKDTNGFGGSNEVANSAAGGRTMSFGDQIAVQVVQQLPNGNLAVQGKKTLVNGNERMDFIVTGVVDPRWLNVDGEISSHNVSNLQFALSGRGTISRNQNEGIFNRFIKYLF